MSKELSQQQKQDLLAKANEAKTALEAEQDKVRDLPQGRETRNLLRVLTSKLALVAEVIAVSVTVDENDIKRWKEELEENGEWLEDFLDALFGAIEAVVTLIIDLFKSIGDKIVTVIENVTGTASVTQGPNNSFVIDGNATAEIRAGGNLPGIDQGQLLGETEGQFRATLVPFGTQNPNQINFYQVTSFKSAANFVALAQVANLEDIREGFDKTRVSIIEVHPDGSVVGEIHTMFATPSLKTQEFGPVLGKMKVTGQLNPNRSELSFTAKSYEIFSADRLG